MKYKFGARGLTPTKRFFLVWEELLSNGIAAMQAVISSHHDYVGGIT